VPLPAAAPADGEKKVRRAAEQDRPDVQQKRQEWAAARPGLDSRRLVFLDETWATTAMSRLYGRAPAGQRLVEAVPAGHWQTTTFVAALRVDGLTAPMVVDGALTGELFEAYIRQVLAPTLRRGDLVVMDNLNCHKVAGVGRALQAARCRAVYLPPYSPDYNPIEVAFAKLKALLRQAAERTVEGLWERLGRSLDDFKAEECRNYFRHCGYVATRSRKAH
jgi:transposase